MIEIDCESVGIEEAWSLRDIDPDAALRLTASICDNDPRKSVLHAFVTCRRGLLQEALAHAVEGLGGIEADPSSPWPGRANNTIAMIYALLGLSDQSINHFMIGDEVSEACGDAELTFSCLHNLARQLGEIGDFEGAIESFDEAETYAGEARDGHAFLAFNRARLHLMHGSITEAQTILDAGRHYWNRPGTHVQVFGLLVETQIAIAANDQDAGRSAIEALRAFPPERVGEEFVLCEARLALARGDLDEAEALLASHDLGPDATLENANDAATLAELHIAIAEQRGDFRQALAISRAITVKERLERDRTLSRLALVLTNESNRQLKQKADQLETQNVQLSKAMAELKALNAQVTELAVRDPLTGLGNRRYLEDHVDAQLRLRERTGRDFCLLVADIDDFKAINDRYLHATGDEVLRRLAEVLSDVTRSADVLCRLGGDEFVVLLPRADLDKARLVAERIQSSVAVHPWSQIADGLHVSISIGAARATSDTTLDGLLLAADTAMYQAKSAGKNRIATTEPIG